MTTWLGKPYVQVAFFGVLHKRVRTPAVPTTIRSSLTLTLLIPICRYTHQYPGPCFTHSPCRLLAHWAVSNELSLPQRRLGLESWEHSRARNVLTVVPILKRPAIRQLPDPRLGRISFFCQLSVVSKPSISIVLDPDHRSRLPLPALSFTHPSSSLSAWHCSSFFLFPVYLGRLVAEPSYHQPGP